MKRQAHALVLTAFLIPNWTRGQAPSGDYNALEVRIRELETNLASETARVKAQDEELDRLRRAVTSLKDDLAAMRVSTGPSGRVPHGDENAPRPEVSAGQTSSANTAPPLSIRLGNALFTPFGFVDLTGIYRSKNVGSGSGTAFGAIPLSPLAIPNQTEADSNAGLAAIGGLPETLVSAQNSRFGLRVDSLYRGTNILGYIETDFVGSSPSDSVITRNSNPLNVRLFFVDLRRSKFEVLAGQSWSLITPNRLGVSALTADIFYTVNLDTNYQVGLIWSRSPQVRFVYHPTSKWAAGVSFENPDQYIGKLVTLPPGLGTYGSEVDTTGAGFAQSLSSSSSSNGQVPNLIPDIVAKVARDGERYHLELGGLLRHFAVVNPTNIQHFGVTGGGISMNGQFQLWRNFALITNTFVSEGGGRFISGLFPDLVARPDGSLSLVKAYSTLSGFEYRVGESSVVSGYYGLAYGQKNTRICPPTESCYSTTFGGYDKPVNGYDWGFGSLDQTYENRVVSEATLGFNHTFWQDPRYGALQFNSQFSYVQRSAWNVALPTDYIAPGLFRREHVYMMFLNLRYLLP